MEHEGSHQLYGICTFAEYAVCSFPCKCESLWEYVVQCFTLGKAILEDLGLLRKIFVLEGLGPAFLSLNLCNDGLQSLYVAFVL